MDRLASYRQQSRGRSMSRRSALGLGGAGIASLVALACAPQRQQPASQTGPTNATQAKRGGVLNRASGPPGSYDTQGVALDPYVNIHAATRTFRLFYQGLLAYDLRTYELMPDLAQKWEQVSELEYVFTLQPNAKWHNKPPANGRLLVSDDIVFSLERARANDPKIVTRSLLDSVDKIQAIDKNRVRITTKEPSAPTLGTFSSNQLLMLAPEVVARANKFSTPEEVVGTGPFILQSIEENVGGHYVRNPDYWKPGLPYLDEVRTRHFNDEQGAWAAFLANQIDITRVPGTESKKYVAQQGPGFDAPWFNNDTSVEAIANTRVKPLDDARVTRALRLMHDHTEMISAWAESEYGRGRFGSVFTTAMERWDLSEEEYSKHLEWKQPKDEAVREAVALLSAAGITRDNPARFELGGLTLGTVQRAMQLLQAQWRKNSQGAVDVQLKGYDPPTSNAVLANKSFAYIITGRSGGTDDPDATFTLLHRTNGSRNYGSWSDPTFDGMVDRQRGILDGPRRKAFVKEMVTYMIDHCPDTIPASYYVLSGVRPRVKGFSPENFINGRQYDELWLDT